MYLLDVELEPVAPIFKRKSFSSVRVQFEPADSVTVLPAVVLANVTLLPFSVVPVKSWHFVDVTRVVLLTRTVTLPVMLVMVALDGMSDVSNV